MAQSTPCRLLSNVLIGLLTFSLTGWGGALLWGQQAPSRPPAQQEKAPAKELEEEREVLEREIQQVIQLLLYARDLAEDIGDPVVRVRSLAAIAEALWEPNEPLARRLFREAFEGTQQVPTPGRPRGLRAWLGSTRAPDVLRTEILNRVAKLDPLFATEMAKSIEPEQEPRREESLEERQMRQAAGSERAQALVNLANVLLEHDPKKASEAAAAALSEGVTQPFCNS